MKQIDERTENARDFMQRMHEELKDDYKFRGKIYGDLCWSLAVTIGKKLFNEYQLPHLEQILAPAKRNKPIVPIRFKGNVVWDRHVVCVCNKNVWDPILGNTEPRETYSKRLLDEELPLRHYKSTIELIKLKTYDYFIDFN